MTQAEIKKALEASARESYTPKTDEEIRSQAEGMYKQQFENDLKALRRQTEQNILAARRDSLSTGMQRSSYVAAQQGLAEQEHQHRLHGAPVWRGSSSFRATTSRTLRTRLPICATRTGTGSSRMISIGISSCFSSTIWEKAGAAENLKRPIKHPKFPVIQCRMTKDCFCRKAKKTCRDILQPNIRICSKTKTIRRRLSTRAVSIVLKTDTVIRTTAVLI